MINDDVAMLDIDDDAAMLDINEGNDNNDHKD